MKRSQAVCLCFNDEHLHSLHLQKTQCKAWLVGLQQGCKDCLQGLHGYFGLANNASQELYRPFVLAMTSKDANACLNGFR